MAIRQKLTIEDYLALPGWDKPHAEYFDGEVIPKVSPSIQHAGLVVALSFYLYQYQEANGGYAGAEPRVELRAQDGGVYFLLPDVAYWAPGKAVQGDRAMLPPTLAIEIRSPGQTMESQRARAGLYRANGVEVSWLVDPEARTVEVVEGDEDPVVLGESAALQSVALPKFTVELERLFAVLDR